MAEETEQPATSGEKFIPVPTELDALEWAQFSAAYLAPEHELNNKCQYPDKPIFKKSNTQAQLDLAHELVFSSDTLAEFIEKHKLTPSLVYDLKNVFEAMNPGKINNDSEEDAYKILKNISDIYTEALKKKWVNYRDSNIKNDANERFVQLKSDESHEWKRERKQVGRKELLLRPEANLAYITMRALSDYSIDSHVFKNISVFVDEKTQYDIPVSSTEEQELRTHAENLFRMCFFTHDVGKSARFSTHLVDTLQRRLVHDTFDDVSAAHGIHRYKADRNPEGTRAHNSFHLNQSRLDDRMPGREDGETWAGYLVDDGKSPVQKAMLNEDLQRMRERMAEILTQQQVDIIEAKFGINDGEAKGWKAIAAELNLSETVVKNEYDFGMKLLSNSMPAADGEFPGEIPGPSSRGGR